MKRTESRAFVRRIRALLPEAVTGAETGATPGADLGDAMDIRAAAALIGCSTWTLRHTLIPRGLPCFRTGHRGKLIFYRHQLVRWIQRHQRAEGAEL